MNVLDSLWTEDDSVFIHEVMRDQRTFLLLAYYFSGTRLGAFLHNGKAEVKGEDGKLDTRVFEGLTWKVSQALYRRYSPRYSIRGLTMSQDVHVYLFPLLDGLAEVVLKIVQRWVKNNKDPEKSVYAFPILVSSRSRSRAQTNTRIDSRFQLTSMVN